eukprot:6779603-Heterocapsa_arctica.AAC.1
MAIAQPKSIILENVPNFKNIEHGTAFNHIIMRSTPWDTPRTTSPDRLLTNIPLLSPDYLLEEYVKT